MKRIASLCCVMLLRMGAPLYSEMEPIDYRGWEGAIRLQNQTLEAVVLPHTGRLVHLSAPGEDNLLTFNADLAGKLPPDEEGDWLNYGGDWIWPVHQDQWEKIGGANWPPPRMLDRSGWHADAEVDEDGTRRVTLRRDFGEPVYIQVERRFELSAGAVAELKVHQSIRRIQASEIPVCLWQISQMQQADQVYFDSNPNAFDGQRYRRVAFDAPDDSVFKTCGDVLIYQAGRGGEHKLGTDGAWIAGRRGNQGLLLWTEGGANGGEFPDGGCSVVMYSNTGLAYSEIETQSREVELAPGEVLRNTVHYRLVELDPADSDCGQAETLQAIPPVREVVSFQPSTAYPESRIEVRIRTKEPGGVLHWGVNGPEGGWELPAEIYWPEGSVAGSTGVAVDTPLPDPVDGESVLILGPFDHPDQVVTSLHAVVRWGNRWDSNEGENYNLVLETHPDAAETLWKFDQNVLNDGIVRLSILTRPPADELQLYLNSELVVSEQQPGLSAGLSAADWEYGPHELRVRAMRNGHLSTDSRRVWKLPEIETSPEPWPLETPYGASVTEEGTWRVHLHAPNARFVEVEWKMEGGNPERKLMQRVGEGRWGLELPLDAVTQFEYQYIVDGENRFADPWSVDVRWTSPQGAYSHLPEHAWSLAGTLPEAPGPWKRPPPETWVVYELSIPDIAPPGSYRGLEDRLDYIAELGVNAIEPLPVTAFPGEISWGYNPAFHMALERSYGTPDDFFELIRAARSHGIAYVADLVLNHVDGSGPLERMHGNPDVNPYTMPFSQFNWGFPKLDQENEAFKRYVKDTLEHWVLNLGVDGFRYDATQWIKWSGYKDWGASWMSYVVNQADPEVVQIAENLPSEPNMVRGTELDMEWDGHYRWRMRKVFSEARITEPEKMREILDPRNHAYDSGFQRMPYIESHDEERFVRELIQKGFTTEQAFIRHHAAAAVTLTVPGMPMLYAGQEWGEMTPKIVGPNPLNWHLKEQPARAELVEKFRELIHLRVQHRALNHDRLDLLHLDADTGLVAYLRPGVPESILVAFNVSKQPAVLDLSSAGIPLAELHNQTAPTDLQAVRLQAGQARIFRVRSQE